MHMQVCRMPREETMRRLAEDAVRTSILLLFSFIFVFRKTLSGCPGLSIDHRHLSETSNSATDRYMYLECTEAKKGREIDRTF